MVDKDRPAARADELLTMNRRNLLELLMALLSVASALRAPANGFRLADQDAFATGRGEAFVATADNASAIYYNPAGLTQLAGSNFRMGIYGIYFDPTFTPPASAPNHAQTYRSHRNLAAAPQFFYACTPENQPVSFGLGIYAPYGGDISWPQDTGFRAVALKAKLTYVTISPVVAYQVAPNFSIGAGLTVNYANIDLEQGLRPFAAPLPNFFRFTGDGWSVGYNLGARWQPEEEVSLGVTFRSEATTTMTGKTEFQQMPVIPATDRFAQADFTFPLTVISGISYRPTPKWNLEFDADYTDWSSMGVVNISQANPPFPLRPVTPVTLKWQPSWMYEFGLTHYFDNGWHASAGYVYNENSVPDKYYSPLAADLDRHFFSVGVGRRGRRLDFDVAYQLGYGPARTVTGSTPPSQPGLFAGQNADGTYDFISHAVIVTVGFRF